MKALAVPLLAVAGLGLVLSVLVHVCALGGLPSLLGKATWALHLGIFVVWIPTIRVIIPLWHGVTRREAMPFLLRGFPPWMRIMVIGLLAYAVLNFALFVSDALGDREGELVVLRGFSGHWMVFYGLACAVLYSYRNTDPASAPCCLNGHPMSARANFCERCGKPARHRSA